MSKTKFVFLIPAFNCRSTIKQTLLSIFSQSYDNWRAIIIDDVSTDDTGTFVEDFSKNCGFGKNIKVIRRDEKYGEVRNTITEIDNIDDDEVVVRVDGGDWLTENDCLYMLDKIYEKHSPAVCWTGQRWAYTNYGISKEMILKPNQSVYDHPWVSSHLKTFRASALKKVDKKNFFDDEGNWIMIACDQAVFLPMMHLAVNNNIPIVFYPAICYHYNIDLNKPDLFTEDRSIMQKQSAEWIRNRGYID